MAKPKSTSTRTKAERKQPAPLDPAQLEALITATHKLITEVIQDGGPFAHRIEYEESGRPDSDSRDAIEDAHTVVTLAAELMRMAYALTFPVQS